MFNPFRFQARKVDSLSSLEDLHLVPHAEFFTSTSLAHNAGQSCGYVGASMILSYWQYRTQQSLTDADLAVPLAAPTAEKHQQKIHDSILGFGRRQSSWAYSIKSAFRRFLSSYGMGGRVRAGLLWLGLFRSLHQGKPVLLFGGLPDVSRADHRYINHAVVAYGWCRVDGMRTVLVHYGWKGQSSWLLNTPFQGSALFFEVE